MLYGVFVLGAGCMLLGFFVIIKGIGASDSETTLKMFTIEFKASKLGPGLVFSILGLILVIFAAESTLSPQTKPGAAPLPQTQPVAQTPAQPQPQPQSQPVVAPAPTPPAPQNTVQAAPPAPANEAIDPSGLSHDQVASLISQTLTKVSNGYCPPENLEPVPLANCFQVGAQVRQVLIAAGPIRGIAYAGKAASPYGDVELYVVQHVNGTFTWKTRMNPDGKFALIWYGPP